MILTVLTENVAGAGFLAEHGLSYLIEHDGERILFDTGHTDVFIKNAEKLQIDIHSEINTVVLSHGHWDHGDGMRFLKKKNIICHPDSFMKRYRDLDNSYIGLAYTHNDLQEAGHTLVHVTQPYKISESMFFCGEIPRVTPFEAQKTTFHNDSGQPDFVPDDSAIAIMDKDKLIIVTGCSHSGICNIIMHAQKITGIHKVKAVIGGFHLKYNDTATQETITFLKEQGIEHIFPSHCTDFDALCAFANAFEIRQLKTGQQLTF